MIQAGDMATWSTTDDLIAEELRTDPEFRAEWERTAIARALAVALVRYRADHDLSQRELAARLGISATEVACLEIGEIEAIASGLMWLSTRLGVEPTDGPEPPGLDE